MSNEEGHGDLAGTLVPLQTWDECRVTFELQEAWVTQVPTQKVASCLSFIDQTIGGKTRSELPHIRHVVRAEHVPIKLRSAARTAWQSSSSKEASFIDHGSSAENEVPAHGTAQGEAMTHLEPAWTYVVLSLVRYMERESIRNHLLRIFSLDTLPCDPILIKAQVPTFAPQSDAEAKRWSREYWPTVYKKHNPLGPQPAEYSRAASSIADFVPGYLNRASQAAAAVKRLGIGEQIGAVLVQRDSSDHARNITLAAGDARWAHLVQNQNANNVNGNPMAHAAMRVIGLAAAKIREARMPASSSVDHDTTPAYFLDRPLTPIEHDCYTASPPRDDGYLCFNMEIYLTHEPCIMCSMAILHSRICRAVFVHQMPSTGGLVAHARQDNPGYGIFWRPALNWKYLAWQWQPLAHEVDVDGHSQASALAEGVYA